MITAPPPPRPAGAKPADGGPAFPRDYRYEGHNGMSLRAYFMATAPITLDDARKVCGFIQSETFANDANRRTLMAVWSLLRREYADAMIEELEVAR